MKKITIISSSLRNKSSSYTIAKKIEEAAHIKNDVSFIDLHNFNLNFCKGCLACQNTGKCVIDDDVKNVLEGVSLSDVIVLVTPIYFYSVSGQLKTFLDRLNPLYIKKNKFKEFYLVLTCADDDILAKEGPEKDIKGFISCFDDVELVDTLCFTNLNSIDDLSSHQEYLDKAFKFGLNL